MNERNECLHTASSYIGSFDLLLYKTSYIWHFVSNTSYIWPFMFVYLLYLAFPLNYLLNLSVLTCYIQEDISFAASLLAPFVSIDCN